MSRYAQHKTIDGCLSPITVFHYGKKYSVPCGKCAACIVNRSNKWNWRLSDEIEAFDYSIFVTFTYNNKYVPKLHLNYVDGLYWLERDKFDIRFDGKKMSFVMMIFLKFLIFSPVLSLLLIGSFLKITLLIPLKEIFNYI